MEKFELVDINGNKTNIVISDLNMLYSEDIAGKLFLPVVKVIIINDNNEVLLQKRSMLKEKNPGRWGICGGKVDFGENTIDAAIRETYEEIGILLNKNDLIKLCDYKTTTGYFTVYYTKNNVSLDNCKMQKEEVDDINYFKMDNLENLYNEGFEWLSCLKEALNN